MSDLIDRAALCEECGGSVIKCVGMGCKVMTMEAVEAVEVVRCKECMHMERNAHFRHCRVWGAINGMGDEGFCNYGERKET